MHLPSRLASLTQFSQNLIAGDALATLEFFQTQSDLTPQLTQPLPLDFVTLSQEVQGFACGRIQTTFDLLMHERFQ